MHNLLHFLRLRADPHAQYEIRIYADEICNLVKEWVPHTYRAFEDYRLGGATLSETSVNVLRRMIKGENVDMQSSGMSKGEWQEFKTLFVD